MHSSVIALKNGWVGPPSCFAPGALPPFLQDLKVIQGQVGPQEAHGPLHPNPNTYPGGEWIFQSSAYGFSNVPILCLLL